MNCIEQTLFPSKGCWREGATTLIILVFLICSCQQQGAIKDEEVRFEKLDLGKTVNVSCFDVEENGSMWLGLDGQGIAYKESADAVPRYYDKLSGTLPSDVVTCIYRDKKGRQWFGSFGNGMFYRESDTFRLPANDSLRTTALEYVAGFAESNDGSFWIATQKSGLIRCDAEGVVTHFNSSNSKLPTNWLADIKTFDYNTLYIATGWGLFSLDTHNNNISPVTDNTGKAFLEKQLIRILYPEGNERLWIGTTTGLYIYHMSTREVTHLTTDDGLGDNLVKAIAQDHKDNFWISSNNTVTRITPQADGTYSCKAFGPESGFGDATFHVRAIVCNKEGQMLFGSSVGVFVAKTKIAVAAAESSQYSFWTIAGWTMVLICLLIAAWQLYHKQKRQQLIADEMGKNYSEVEPSKIEVQSINDQFLERAIELVEKNIDDIDFSVEQLSSEMGLSRGHLYKRLIAITGKTPIEFIRTIRIKRGHQLLEQSGNSISQIAWAVGMSPKQFSKYFKEAYGLLPSDFIRQQSEE